MRTRIRRALQVLVFIPLLSTCGGGSDGGGPVAAKLTVALAPPASLQNGVAFPLEIQVAAADGSPVDEAGVPVTLSVSGGRTLNGTTTVNTGSDGVAQFTGLTLTGTAGTVQLTATAPALTQVTTGNINLTAGVPATLTITAGDSQNAEVAKAPANPLKVRVRDAAGNNVAGTSLTLTISAGSGSLDAATAGVTTRQVVSDGSGVATLGVWRMGNLAATNRLVVTVTSNGAVPGVTLVAQGIHGPMASPVLSGLLPGVVTVGTTYAAPFKVVAKDSLGNPIQGVQVTFTGTGDKPFIVYGGTGSTDATGTFTVDSVRTGTIAGDHSLHVAYAYNPSLATFASNATIAVKAGPFSRVVVGPNSAAALTWVRSSGMGMEFATVDRYGNMVGEIPVHAAVVSGSAILGQGDSSNTFGLFDVSMTTPATAGDVVVRAANPSVPDSSADITVHVVAPTTIASLSPDTQVVAGGDTLPAPLRVLVTDAGGDPVLGVPVLLNNYLLDTTDASGIAAFKLSAFGALGTSNYYAASPWLPDTVRWVVQTVAGPPAHLYYSLPPDTGVVGTTLATSQGVLVTDAIGTPLAGVAVHFAAARGNIVVDDAVTDNAGHAYPGDWQLDTLSGTDSAAATVAALPPLYVHAVALPDLSATLTLLAGPAAEGFANERLAIGVRVVAKDRYGNRTPGRQLVLTPPAGGSLSLNGAPLLDSLGQAYVDGWNLALSPGVQQLGLSVDSASLQVGATVYAASPFDIQVRGVDPAYAADFRRAAYRWRRRITADIPDLTGVNIPAGACAGFQQAVSGFVDDLIIDVSIGEIDGPGAILGGAGPCYIRNVDSLPLLGVMQFDIQDLAMLRAQGTLGDVILHEMGHVLGIGSLWSGKNLVTGAGTSNPVYTGAGGEQGWAEIGGTGTVTVPVENTGGQGTADSHWRETSMPSELMTGYLSALVNPMSRVTVRSLGDLGYAVDPATADAYSAFTAPRPAPGDRGGVRIQDRVTRPIFTVGPDGKIHPIQ